mmetsp:Transcript_80322/g.236280  ORF Transcript_80322/g.236280 Transcript_80322/m.236280 type:complete len:265 (-) Transcript_80322:273-1067(-)
MAYLVSSALEEGHELPRESSERASLLVDARTATPTADLHVRERVAWRLAALGVTALALLGAASGALLPKRAKHYALTLIGAREAEQKFYDTSGAYWQAPGRGISTSELWVSCEHPHMHTCSGYCCCDESYYWNSQKTVYQQGKPIVKEAAVRTAVKESHQVSAAVAEEAAKNVAAALGKAAVASMISEQQKCVQQADVPSDVAQALKSGDLIPGSDEWLSCGAFTSNSHTCGTYCCCNGGFEWSISNAACLSKARGPGREGDNA